VLLSVQWAEGIHPKLCPSMTSLYPLNRSMVYSTTAGWSRSAQWSEIVVCAAFGDLMDSKRLFRDAGNSTSSGSEWPLGQQCQRKKYSVSIIPSNSSKTLLSEPTSSQMNIQFRLYLENAE
jgi:hypothetical protein